MADVSIQGNKSAFGSMSGAQALQTTTIPASQKQEITKTHKFIFRSKKLTISEIGKKKQTICKKQNQPKQLT